MNNITELVKDEFLLFDGALGTMLQNAGMPVGELPELWGMRNPEVLLNIHREYVEAGADIVTANTFQANARKLALSGRNAGGGAAHRADSAVTIEDVVGFSVKLAKMSGARFAALDIGPLGQMIEPVGTLTFDEAYEDFRRQAVAGEASGADCVVIETFSDLFEAKAAVLAVKENTNLPVLCTLTWQSDGRTFVGVDPISAAVTLSGLGVNALGVNCSLGPSELLPIVRQLLAHSKPPVMVQANAGLPRYADGMTVYDISPEQYAAHIREMALMGVRIFGGCCGTTPEYIRAVKRALRGVPCIDTSDGARYTGAVSSGIRTFFLGDGVTVIGERINPTGKKRFREELLKGSLEYALGEGVSQAEAGCDALDVNVGIPAVDEPRVMAKLVRALHGVVNLPLQIDSADPAAIEAGVRACAGRPIINSVNGKQSVMDAVFPIAKKYGAAVVGLTLDEHGIPNDAEGRVVIARKIVERAADFGIAADDILIDCLTLTVSAEQKQAFETLRALRRVKEELGVHTVLGVSNVSFGLPAREKLNSVFLAAALGAGLDAPILNPLSERYMDVIDGFRVLSSEDKGAARYIIKQGNSALMPGAQSGVISTGSSQLNVSLSDIISRGLKHDAARAVSALLETTKPVDIINNYFVPSLNSVGRRFETGEIFLPQLLSSAETVKAGFEALRASMADSGEIRRVKGRVLLATVQGDIHDIGKNIVKTLLENYGFDVLDMGKDVPPESIVDAISNNKIRLAGLSALMTTTVPSIEKTIALARAKNLSCKFMVGGAVLTQEYASVMGADYYARDAMEGVAIAECVLAH